MQAQSSRGEKEHMDSVNKTLYIPLYGKAYVSQKGILLNDKKAEQIWAAEGFALKGKAKSKWLAYYMGMRSAVFDEWLRQQMSERQAAAVIHIGCGLDSRILRLAPMENPWYDIDFPAVIAERSRYFRESDTYHMIGVDVRENGWLDRIQGRTAIVLMEGVSMYLFTEDLRKLLQRISAKFESVMLLMDVYSEFAARASRVKNPINDVGVTQVYGLDDPLVLEDTGLKFVQAHDMCPPELTAQLKGAEKWIFENLYNGAFARKLYSLYEYSSGQLSTAAEEV